MGGGGTPPGEVQARRARSVRDRSVRARHRDRRAAVDAWTRRVTHRQHAGGPARGRGRRRDGGAGGAGADGGGRVRVAPRPRTRRQRCQRCQRCQGCQPGFIGRRPGRRPLAVPRARGGRVPRIPKHRVLGRSLQRSARQRQRQSQRNREGVLRVVQGERRGVQRVGVGPVVEGVLDEEDDDVPATGV